MCRAGGEKRGNNHDRFMRKLWMLRTFGNGVWCRCMYCRVILLYATVEADRIIPGGRYSHDNVQPACRNCNLARSNNESWSYGIAA
jgi:hypothetical protein